MPYRSIQRTVFPFGYDKNGAADRNSKDFAPGFNKWAQEIKSANHIDNSIMDARLDEAKRLINQII